MLGGSKILLESNLIVWWTGGSSKVLIRFNPETLRDEQPELTTRNAQSWNGRHQGYNKLIKVSLTYLKVRILITIQYTSPTTGIEEKSNKQAMSSQQSTRHNQQRHYKMAHRMNTQ